MKGVILAGGRGTRLAPATWVYNKHLALVYDRPMIYYPLTTLINMGCDEITIVSTESGVKGIERLFGDGSKLKNVINITYKVQLASEGIAQALGCIDPIDDLFPVILGDNYFEKIPEMTSKPAIFTCTVENPERFGVYNPKNGKIKEKPLNPASKQAVTGLYVYDEKVFSMIPTLKKSDRGEYEITDINNMYLKDDAFVKEIKGVWKDMGTPDSLLEVANHVKV